MMKYHNFFGLLALLVTVSIGTTQEFNPSLTVSKKLTNRELMEDFQLFKKGLEKLHPGLYKYKRKNSIDVAFKELEQELLDGASVEEVFLKLSRMTAYIQCGHTYLNFVNQDDALVAHFSDRKDKLPFTFRIYDERMFVVENASTKDIKRGSEITSIHGHRTLDILNNLMNYIKADGDNDGKRLYDLQVFGIDHFEAFDIFFSLLYQPSDEIEITFKEPGTETEIHTNINLISREERFNQVKDKALLPSTVDEYWSKKVMDSDIMYLHLGTFVTWRMKMNWKNFLKKAFKELESKNINNLIIDIRGNEGGNADVQKELYSYLRTKESRVGPWELVLTGGSIPEDLKPFLSSWNKKLLNMKVDVVPMGNGLYQKKDGGLINGTQPVSKKAYKGKVYVICDSYNSSGTFFLVKYLKDNQLATIVGQETGGNLNGLTSTQVVQLVLPNTRLSVDIPLIGTYSQDKQPNRGVFPDVFVKQSQQHIVDNRDVELETLLHLIKNK